MITTITTLVVAGLVLLPRLEHSLRQAAKSTLQKEVQAVKQDKQDRLLVQLASVDYQDMSFTHGAESGSGSSKRPASTNPITNLQTYTDQLRPRLGATSIGFVGYIDEQGQGCAINLTAAVGGATAGGARECNDSDLGSLDDVTYAFLHKHDYYSFSQQDGPEVRAAIYLPPAYPGAPDPDAVVVVRKSIAEIPGAVAAVRHAFAIAAGLGLILTLLLAIPLAATLVRRLRRLREAALQLAISGTGVEFPVDRARDEVGDLARSFAIMQRRLHRQEEARRAFVATASHELRTPLASLDAMLELLSDDLQSGRLDQDEAALLLERARVQSRRLGRLAADLLDLSRLDAEVSLREEPIELGELARAVLAEFELRARERGASAVMAEAQIRIWALADPGSVARILRILIDNALRVAPAGTEVTVRVTDEPSPRLSVIDHGPGVPAQERTMIFERFQRGAETGGEAGFGLGLAIGRELAERMDGQLELADGDGPGATFTLTLRPASAPAGEPIASTAGA